jgi:hypothetical protein
MLFRNGQIEELSAVGLGLAVMQQAAAKREYMAWGRLVDSSYTQVEGVYLSPQYVVSVETSKSVRWYGFDMQTCTVRTALGDTFRLLGCAELMSLALEVARDEQNNGAR